jgi:hypothetical protein
MKEKDEDKIPVVQARVATEADKRWLTIFEKIEENQLELLDQSGKRIVELTGVLLGVLLGATSFGDKFPPAYLSNSGGVKFAVVVILAAYILAMVFGMLTASPRNYKRYRNNLTEMENVFNQIVEHKVRMLRIAGLFFLVGSIALAVLLAILVLQAQPVPVPVP